MSFDQNVNPGTSQTQRLACYVVDLADSCVRICNGPETKIIVSILGIGGLDQLAKCSHKVQLSKRNQQMKVASTTTSLLLAAQFVYGVAQDASERDLTGYYGSVGIAECQGDCDWDEDCEKGLSCWYREPQGSTEFRHFNYPHSEVPGCPGVVPFDHHKDFCIDPHKFPVDTLFYAGQNSFPRVVYPLKHCWGNCKQVSRTARMFVWSILKQTP